MDIGLLFTNGWKRLITNYKLLFTALFFVYFVPTLIVSYVGLPYAYELEALQNVPDQEFSVVWAYITSHAGFFITAFIVSLLTGILFYVIPLLVFCAKKKQRSLQIIVAALPISLRVIGTLLCLLLLVIPGLILLLIPGIILLVYFNFAFIESVVKKSTGFTALSASWQLVRGRWWLTLVIALFLALVTMGLSIPVSLLFDGLPQLLNKLAGTLVFSYIFLPISILATACVQLFAASLSYEWYVQFNQKR